MSPQLLQYLATVVVALLTGTVIASIVQAWRAPREIRMQRTAVEAEARKTDAEVVSLAQSVAYEAVAQMRAEMAAQDARHEQELARQRQLHADQMRELVRYVEDTLREWELRGASPPPPTFSGWLARRFGTGSGGS